MSAELDYSLLILVRIVTAYLILLVVTAAATTFLRVLTYFKTQDALKRLSLLTLERPDERKDN